MSVLQMAMVWKCQLAHNQQSVLLALADHADDDGSNCYPSLPYIAWKTDYSVRQVRRVVKGLRDLGVLLPLEDTQSAGAPIHYQINLAALPAKSTYTPSKKDYARLPLRLAVIERDEQTCHYCRERGTISMAPDGNAWHMDRVIPGSAGGTYTEDNVVLACGPCNRVRGDRADKLTPLPKQDAEGDTGTPDADIIPALTTDTQMSAKPPVTTIQPSGELSATRVWWLETLRGIDGWDAKGEPHIDTLHAWVLEKGWELDQLEASALGLASCKDKTLKGYRDMAGAFQRRLNQGYDDPTRQQNGVTQRGAGAVPREPGGQTGGARTPWDNRG